MAGSVPLAFRISANLDDMRKALAEGIAQLETTKSAMRSAANGLDGSKLIANANAMTKVVTDLGGAATLTAREQKAVNATLEQAIEKYALLGRQAPVEMRELAAATKQADDSGISWLSMLSGAKTALATLGISLSVGALVQMARALLDDADALTKMHDKTGVSVEGLQAMRAAGDDAGVTLEAMTSAVNMLQKRLGGDDQSAIKALQDLGINVEKFAALDGAEQMAALSDAVRGMHDPLRVANDLSGLFGKGWSEVLPVLKRGFEEVETGSGQMSRSTVKALDDAGDALTRFWRAFKANAGEAVADVLTLSSSWDRKLDSQLESMVDKAVKAGPRLRTAITADGALPKDLDEIYAKFEKDKEAIDANAKAAEEAARKFKVWQGAMEELDGVGANWRETLAGMNGLVVEGIKYYLDAGVSQGTLATAYGVTATQVRAVASSLEEERKLTAAVKAEHDKFTAAMDNLNLAGKGWMKTLDDIDGNVVEAIKYYLKAGVAQADLATAYGLTATQIRSVASALDVEAAAAQRAGDALARVYTENIGFVGSSEAYKAAALKAAAEGAKTGLFLTPDMPLESSINSNAGFRAASTVLNGLSGRVGGGDVSGGMPYIVGEERPELFVPKTSGTIIPYVPNGGVTINVTVDARDSFFDNPIGVQKLAEKVGAAIGAQLRSRGVAVA